VGGRARDNALWTGWAARALHTGRWGGVQGRRARAPWRSPLYARSIELMQATGGRAGCIWWSPGKSRAVRRGVVRVASWRIEEAGRRLAGGLEGGGGTMDEADGCRNPSLSSSEWSTVGSCSCLVSEDAEVAGGFLSGDAEVAHGSTGASSLSRTQDRTRIRAGQPAPGRGCRGLTWAPVAGSLPCTRALHQWWCESPQPRNRETVGGARILLPAGSGECQRASRGSRRGKDGREGVEG
jgi:hypothetical protein